MSNLLTFMKYEEQLICELVELAESQQNALISYNIKELEKVSLNQSEISKKLKEAEEQRMKYFMSWLGISRKEAQELKISALENKFSTDEASELNNLKHSIKTLVTKLNLYNSMNRALANRGINSTRELLYMFSNGNNYVCNVKV